jgi:hypothetical protein
MKRRTLQITAVSVVALSVLSWLVMWQANHPVEQAEQSAHATPASAGKAHADTHHTHEVSPALKLEGNQYKQLTQYWFEAPVLQNAQQFAPSSTPLAVDQNCAQRPEVAHSTLEAAITTSTGIDLTQTTPTDALVQQLTQFWQQEGWYYQLSAQWDKDSPATYRLNFFRAKQSDFANDVERLPLEQSEGVDIVAAGQRMDTQVAKVTGQARGARVAHVLLNGAQGDAMQDLKLVNGQPMAWMFGHGHCRVTQAGQAQCVCIDPQQSSAEAKKSHQVID